MDGWTDHDDDEHRWERTRRMMVVCRRGVVDGG
jgi:hypothetical protein